MNELRCHDNENLSLGFLPIRQEGGQQDMLWTLAVIFFILWIVGLAGAYAIGAWIWLFFAIWIISLIAQLAGAGRRRTTTSPQHM